MPDKREPIKDAIKGMGFGREGTGLKQRLSRLGYGIRASTATQNYVEATHKRRPDVTVQRLADGIYRAHFKERITGSNEFIQLSMTGILPARHYISYEQSGIYLSLIREGNFEDVMHKNTFEFEGLRSRAAEEYRNRRIA